MKFSHWTEFGVAWEFGNSVYFWLHMGIIADAVIWDYNMWRLCAFRLLL